VPIYVGNVRKHILSYGAALKRITILRSFINQEMFSSKSWPQNLHHGLIFKQAGNMHQRKFCTKI